MRNPRQTIPDNPQGIQSPLSGGFFLRGESPAQRGKPPSQPDSTQQQQQPRRPTQKEVTYEIREGPLLPSTEEMDSSENGLKLK